jgi:predicted RNase H-like HicB family nuclease
VTQGDSVEDAIAQAREVIQAHIEGLLADGEPVPEERERPQMVTVRVAT